MSSESEFSGKQENGRQGRKIPEMPRNFDPSSVASKAAKSASANEDEVRFRNRFVADADDLIARNEGSPQDADELFKAALKKKLRSDIDKARTKNKAKKPDVPEPQQAVSSESWPLESSEIDTTTRIVDRIRWGMVDREIVELLFVLKDEFLQHAHKIPADFQKAFFDAVCVFVLGDMDSPGEIDEGEAKWLRKCMLRNGRMDQVDMALIGTLKSQSLNFSDFLVVKSKQAQRADKVLYGMRYLAWLAIGGSLASALVLFAGNSIFLVHVLLSHTFWPSLANVGFRFGWMSDKVSPLSVEHVEPSLESLVEALVSCVDIYLFAMVLLIFGVGIYELFIQQRDAVDQARNHSPAWLRISSIDDLKASLGKSILMVLIVALYKHALRFGKTDAPVSVQVLLYFAGVIVLVAAALHLTHSHGEGEHSPTAGIAKISVQKENKKKE